MLDDSFQHLSI